MNRLNNINSKSSAILGKVVCKLEELKPKKTRNELIATGKKFLYTYHNKVEIEIKSSHIVVTKNDWC